MRATGDDSLVALFETAAGALIQLAYVPSGPGRRWIQRSVHGRDGSMSVPRDRTGGAVVVDARRAHAQRRRAARASSAASSSTGVAADFFGAEGTEYDLPFAEVDAATIAIELDDFLGAVAEQRLARGRRARRPAGRRRPSGRSPSRARAAAWCAIADVADGTISAAQEPIDVRSACCTEASWSMA